MTSSLFWQLLIPAIASLALITWLTVKVCEAVERRWRRRQMRKEMERLIVASLQRSEHVIQALQAELMDEILATRRRQLDGLATTQDKASRRIVH